MTKLTLVRGIPGSGKSTLAKQIVAATGAAHFEADMFFMQEGEYKFDPLKLHQAHSWCMNQAIAELAKDRDVVVSNTFTTIKELRSYFEIAKTFKITPNVVLAQNQFPNVHGVPEDKMAQMKARFVYDLAPLFEEFSK